MIIGILILIAIVGGFYKLASEYGRKYAWLYSVAGVASFYGSFYISAFAVGFICFFAGEPIEEATLYLVSVPVAFAGCAGLYYLLKRNWKKQEKAINNDILDDQI